MSKFYKYMSTVPKLFVFDLDSCLWTPEMYQTGGKKFKTEAKSGDARCCKDVLVRLMGDSRAILFELITQPQFEHSKLAVASRGDSERHEKGWAKDCLAKMRIGPKLDEG